MNNVLMKRTDVFFLILVNLFLLVFMFMQTTTLGQTIVIDPGHGGKDPGAIGKHAYEKDITLGISLKVGNYLKKYMPGINVIYTRSTDEFIELHKRAEVANRNKADLFVSVHVNASTSREPYGTSTYVMGLNKSKENIEAAKRENNVILQEKDYQKNYDGYAPDSLEMEIIFNLFQNEHLKQSLDLAQRIQNQFEHKAHRKNRGVKQAGLVVLWQSTMPSVLVETGFITNATEENYLRSTYGQELIASAIYRAIKYYLIDNNLYHPKKAEKNTPSPNVYFTVQVKSSPQKVSLNHHMFQGLGKVTERKGNTQYYYTVGKTTSAKELYEIQKKVRQKIPDAFAIGIENEKRISYAQAKRLLN